MDLRQTLFPAPFPPSTVADVDAMEEALLPAIAGYLQEPATRDALRGRSSELLPLVDDLLADCTAFALACQRHEPEETTAQLRAVAQYASEALVELLDGMTFSVALESTPVVIKLSEQQGAWGFSFTDPGSATKRAGASRSTTLLPTKAAARESAVGAIRERRA